MGSIQRLLLHIRWAFFLISLCVWVSVLHFLFHSMGFTELIMTREHLSCNNRRKNIYQKVLMCDWWMKSQRCKSHSCFHAGETWNRASQCCRTVPAPPASLLLWGNLCRKDRGQSHSCAPLVQNGKYVCSSVLGAAVSVHATLACIMSAQTYKASLSLRLSSLVLGLGLYQNVWQKHFRN